jgi:alcohol dehydrogenase (cytochrome c)
MVPLTMVAGATLTLAVIAQVNNYKPVTQEKLRNPGPDDWLMYSRTNDAQRYSSLKHVNKGNVGIPTAVPV